MLSDEDIQDVTTNAVRARKLSWLGFKQDEQGEYRVPVLSPSDFQFARAIESAACAERDARIAELEQQLAEARKDAELLDWLDKQNADIENDAWVVLAHDCAGDEDCKKYWVGADLRIAIRAAIKEQT